MNKETNHQNDAYQEIDRLWDFTNPKESEVKFRALLSKSNVKDSEEFYTVLLTQIARSQGLQRKFTDAHSTLDKANEVITEKMIIPKIRYYLERGRVYNSSGEQSKASNKFKLAYKLSIDNNQDFYAVDAAHMLGISEEPSNQLEWNHKAIEMAEKSNNPKSKRWLGPLYNNTGWTYHDMKQFDKALELFYKSLEWREEHQNETEIFIAKWTIARTYRSLNRVQEALDIQFQLLEDITSGKANPDGYVYEEIAECLLLQNNNEKAKTYFNEAYKLLSKDEWLQANESERLKRLKELGN